MNNIKTKDLEMVFDDYDKVEPFKDKLEDNTHFFVLLKDNQPIGYIRFFDNGSNVPIHYEVIESEQKKGYMTQAIYAFDEWVFNNTDIKEIEGIIPHEWMMTKSVLEHNGYERQEDLEEGVRYTRRRKDTPTNYIYEPKENEGVIYLAGGCFWGLEKAFGLLDGVIDTTVGYANGYGEDPTYEKICQEETGYKETVRIIYDKSQLSLEKILKAFFLCIDPTVKNRQGNDVGEQYQTGVYYTDEDSRDIARKIFEEKKKEIDPFCVELEPLRNFFLAEDYHQDYLVKHPNGYCHISGDEYEAIRRLNEHE